MVERHARDHADLGRDHVGAVEPATDAHFDHRQVAALIAKPLESQQRADLEEGQLGRARRGQKARELGHAPRELALRHGPTVDAEALHESMKVR
jgi:hypothetical protein